MKEITARFLQNQVRVRVSSSGRLLVSFFPWSPSPPIIITTKYFARVRHTKLTRDNDNRIDYRETVINVIHSSIRYTKL